MTDTDIDPGQCLEADILENALVMIVILDRKGTIYGWNLATENLTGYAKRDVIGRSDIWKRLYPDRDYRHSVNRKIAEIIEGKDFFTNLETQIVTKKGETRNILWNTKEVTQYPGVRIIAVGVDVTDARKAEAINSSIIENSNVLITVLGEGGMVLVWNRAAEMITGYQGDEVLGSREIWKRLYPDQDYRKVITGKIARIIRENHYFENLETRIRTKSGEEHVISWNTRQIGTEGQYLSIAIGRDITAIKRAEEALIAYMMEMAMRIRQPVEIIRDNLTDVAGLARQGKLSLEEIGMLLDGQIRNASQVATNVTEFQRAVLEKHEEIPDTYREFLKGE